MGLTSPVVPLVRRDCMLPRVEGRRARRGRDRQHAADRAHRQAARRAGDQLRLQRRGRLHLPPAWRRGALRRGLRRLYRPARKGRRLWPAGRAAARGCSAACAPSAISTCATTHATELGFVGTFQDFAAATRGDLTLRAGPFDLARACGRSGRLGQARGAGPASSPRNAESRVSTVEAAGARDRRSATQLPRRDAAPRVRGAPSRRRRGRPALFGADRILREHRGEHARETAADARDGSMRQRDPGARAPAPERPPGRRTSTATEDGWPRRRGTAPRRAAIRPALGGGGEVPHGLGFAPGHRSASALAQRLGRACGHGARRRGRRGPPHAPASGRRGRPPRRRPGAPGKRERRNRDHTQTKALLNS